MLPKILRTEQNTESETEIFLITKTKNNPCFFFLLSLQKITSTEEGKKI